MKAKSRLIQTKLQLLLIKSNLGFTLIEVLIAIVIIGLLSAVALPSFLGQVTKAQQTEAKINLSEIIKNQQIYYNENQEFVTDNENWRKLNLSFRKNTNNYKYKFIDLTILDDAAVGVVANTKKKSLKSYSAGVSVVSDGKNINYLTRYCENKKPATESSINYKNYSLECGEESNQL